MHSFDVFASKSKTGIAAKGFAVSLEYRLTGCKCYHIEKVLHATLGGIYSVENFVSDAQREPFRFLLCQACIPWLT